MRGKIVGGVAFALLLAACGQKKGASMSERAEVPVVDTFMDSTDSLLIFSEAQEEGMSSRADELFDDFVFEFARLGKLRAARVKFPLLQVKAGDTTWIPKERWKYEPLFTNQDYYTVFYNHEEQMELEKRTDLSFVEVEQFDLQRRSVKASRFEKLDGKWMLTQERINVFGQSGPLEQFLAFYQRFVADSLFQVKSISSPLRYVTTDPEDDFGTVEGTLDVAQWQAFKPQLPDSVLTNVRYGQTYDDPDDMILVKAGISNGLMDILYFKKRRGAWKLVAYEN